MHCPFAKKIIECTVTVTHQFRDKEWAEARPEIMPLLFKGDDFRLTDIESAIQVAACLPNNLIFAGSRAAAKRNSHA